MKIIINYIWQGTEKFSAWLKADLGGAHDVMVIIVGNGHGDMSSNPGRDW